MTEPMTIYRIRLRDSGAVDSVEGESYTIDPRNVLSIYKNGKPIAEYAPKGWVWIKTGRA